MPSAEILSQCFGLNGTLSLENSAGVPGPSPVVRLAAEYADSVGRRVDKPHVLDLHLRDLEVLQSGEERSDIAALSTLLTRGNALLQPALDQIVTLAVRYLGVDIPRDRAGDLGDGGCHKDPGTGAIRQFFAPRLCQIAVLQQVALRGGVELQSARDAVMIGNDESVRRHGRGGTAAQR